MMEAAITQDLTAALTLAQASTNTPVRAIAVAREVHV